MKNLFKKYITSVLSPDEFSRFSDFIGQKKNDPVISGLMKSAWKEQLHNTEIESKPNPTLFKRIKEEIRSEKLKKVKFQ